MGILAQLGQALQAGGESLKGNTQVANRLFDDLDRKKKQQMFQEQVAQMGADPHDPMTWNEDVLALAARTGVMDTQQILNLGIQLQQRRLAQQRAEREGKKFSWAEQDRQRALSREEEMKQLLGQAKTPEQATELYYKKGFLDPAEYAKWKQEMLSSKERLADAKLRRQKYFESEAERKKRETEEYQKRKELVACNGDPACEHRVHLKYGEKDSWRPKEKKEDTDKKIKVLAERLGYMATGTNSLPQFVIQKAMAGNIADIPTIKELAPLLNMKFIYRGGDANKPCLLVGNKVIPIGWKPKQEKPKEKGGWFSGLLGTAQSSTNPEEGIAP